MKLFVSVILAIVCFGSIGVRARGGLDFEELEDGLEPSLKELRAAVDAAWELEKRKEEGDLEKRFSIATIEKREPARSTTSGRGRFEDDSEDLMAMVDAALEKLSARKQQEAEMNQQAEMMNQETEEMAQEEMMDQEAEMMDQESEDENLEKRDITESKIPEDEYKEKRVIKMRYRGR